MVIYNLTTVLNQYPYLSSSSWQSLKNIQLPLPAAEEVGGGGKPAGLLTRSSQKVVNTHILPTSGQHVQCSDRLRECVTVIILTLRTDISILCQTKMSTQYPMYTHLPRALPLLFHGMIVKCLLVD